MPLFQTRAVTHGDATRVDEAPRDSRHLGGSTRGPVGECGKQMVDGMERPHALLHLQRPRRQLERRRGLPGRPDSERPIACKFRGAGAHDFNVPIGRSRSSTRALN